MTLTPPTAAPLAHDAMIQAMVEHGWYMQDDFLEPASVCQLADEMEQLYQQGLFRPAGIGRGTQLTQNADIRGDELLWLDAANSPPRLSAFLAQLEGLRLAINQQLLLGLFDMETQAASYQPGSGYQCHLDNFHDSNQRVLTLLLYLNPDWQARDGGNLRLHLDEAGKESHLDIAPVAGRLLLFFSARFAHEVLTTQRHRLSLTTWFRRRKA